MITGMPSTVPVGYAADARGGQGKSGRGGLQHLGPAVPSLYSRERRSPGIGPARGHTRRTSNATHQSGLGYLHHPIHVASATPALGEDFGRITAQAFDVVALRPLKPRDPPYTRLQVNLVN